jgi:phosphonate transport system ATP-binding protein
MKIDARQLHLRHAAAGAHARAALRLEALSVDAGEQVAVIGPSGAGKTTLLQALACAMRPHDGALSLDGRDPWQLPAAELRRLRARLFLAPQVPPLPPRQRVVTAVLAGRLPAQGLLASLASLVYPSDIPGAWSALESFDLGDKLFERVDRLSGGERQRVSLARALVSPASLWLADEPLSALDPTRARSSLSALTAQARERGATLVASLHQVDLALAQFPRVIGLRDGALAFDLPAADVTPQRLARLYAQHEDELQHAAEPADLRPDDQSAAARPGARCR